MRKLDTTLRGVARKDRGSGSKLKKSSSQIWPKLCQNKVDMTLRTLPGRFRPKRFGCLATGAQKWRENQKLTNFTLSVRDRAVSQPLRF